MRIAMLALFCVFAMADSLHPPSDTGKRRRQLAPVKQDPVELGIEEVTPLIDSMDEIEQAAHLKTESQPVGESDKANDTEFVMP